MPATIVPIDTPARARVATLFLDLAISLRTIASVKPEDAQAALDMEREWTQRLKEYEEAKASAASA